jgi:hypothetical protein
MSATAWLGSLSRLAGVNEARVRRETPSTFAKDLTKYFAQVGEWLKPTDCKSVPPSEVRRFESFPVHQIERFREL